MSRQPIEQMRAADAAHQVPPQLALDEALGQALAKAAACHTAGQFSEAEQLYRAIIQVMPKHAVANHRLGLLEVEQQRPADALPHLLAALEASPETSQHWLSYIDALLLASQDEDAREVLALARRHGLSGDAAEALARRLGDSQQGTPSPEVEELEDAGQRQALPRNDPSAHAMEPSADEIDSLVALFNAGEHSECEDLAVALTERYPEHGFGWKALGALLKLEGRNAEALVAMRRAVRLLPGDGEAHSNLGLVLADLGKLVDAEACHRRATKINSKFAEAHYNLGNVLHARGRIKAAVASYRRAVALKPDLGLAHCNLGNALTDLARHSEAEATYRRALAVQPSLAEAHNNLGRNLKRQGRFHEAEMSYRKALALKPDYADAHNNLGDTLRGLGRPADAEEALRRALKCQPDFAEAHFNLGNVHEDQGRVLEAEAAWRCALSSKPDFPEALAVLGATLREQGQLSEAENYLRRAVEHNPAFFEAHYNLGNILRDQERLGEAEASFRRALKLNPGLTKALLNLGVTLTELGRHTEGEASCRQALALEPDYPLAHSNLLYCLSHNEKIDAKALFAEHCRFGEQFEAPLRAEWSPHSNTKDPDRCLRVGLVSADMRNHAVASFLEPVLAQLASCQNLSLYAYANHPAEDQVTERLRQYLPHWHQVSAMSDAALAEQIRSDGIDILLDLSGHTARHRLLTFARKPAPLQASWIGYPGTTGLQAMDYYLADRFFLPVGQFDEQFTEKIVRLPVGAPFLPFADSPSVNALPALRQGHITFGSFNRPTKLSRSVIALWSELLRALPNSRLLLGSMRPDPGGQQLIDEFTRQGISADSLGLHPRCAMASYLELHHQVDICLDTFPYTGGTTTLHALSMGVPTLTLVGQTVPGRSGASILGHVGLEEFITQSSAEFVARGLSWSSDLAALARLRAELRERLQRSAMGQPDLVASGLARALRMMWQRWCSELPAEAFEVLAHDLSDRPPVNCP